MRNTSKLRRRSEMRFHTLSVVVGGLACNARCPFCIASMTPASGLTLRATPPDQAALDRVFALARDSGVDQVMLTGKGEPTLWPDHITDILGVLAAHRFPRIDLQTNGVAIADGRIPDETLARWRALGLSLIAISVVGHDEEANRANYLPYRTAYIDLPALIDRLHGHGFAVRLAVVMAEGLVDGPDLLRTGTPAARVTDWIREHVSASVIAPAMPDGRVDLDALYEPL